jgi:hypothetical protein
MPKYTALLAYDVSYYADVEFEAESDEQAIEIAKRMAHDCDGGYSPAHDMADGHRVCDVTREEDGDIIAEGIDV